MLRVIEAADRQAKHALGQANLHGESADLCRLWCRGSVTRRSTVGEPPSTRDHTLFEPAIASALRN